MDDMTKEALETIEYIAGEEFEKFRSMFLDAVNDLPDESFAAIMPKISDVVYGFGLIGDEKFERVISQAERCLKIDKNLFALCRLLIADNSKNYDKSERKKCEKKKEDRDPIHDFVTSYDLVYFGKIGVNKLYTGTDGDLEAFRKSVCREQTRHLAVYDCINGYTRCPLNHSTLQNVLGMIVDRPETHWYFNSSTALAFIISQYLDESSKEFWRGVGPGNKNSD